MLLFAREIFVLARVCVYPGFGSKLVAVNKPTVACFARKISGANADSIKTSLSYCRAGEQGCREMSLQENRAWTIYFKNLAANWAIMSGLFLRLNDNKTIFPLSKHNHFKKISYLDDKKSFF